MDGQNVRCFWSFVEALPILIRSSRLCRSVQETQVAWWERNLKPKLKLKDTKSRWFWRIIPKWTGISGWERWQVTAMRLLFDIVMAQNIRIFGYKSDQNNLHTGCMFMRKSHIDSYTIWYNVFIYIYIRNMSYVHHICEKTVFAQKVFLEAGLKFPLSVNSIYEFAPERSIHFVLSEGTRLSHNCPCAETNPNTLLSGLQQVDSATCSSTIQCYDWCKPNTFGFNNKGLKSEPIKGADVFHNFSLDGAKQSLPVSW